jgi:hypothetical protein
LSNNLEQQHVLNEFEDGGTGRRISRNGGPNGVGHELLVARRHAGFAGTQITAVRGKIGDHFAKREPKTFKAEIA